MVRHVRYFDGTKTNGSGDLVAQWARAAAFEILYEKKVVNKKTVTEQEKKSRTVQVQWPDCVSVIAATVACMSRVKPWGRLGNGGFCVAEMKFVLRNRQLS